MKGRQSVSLDDTCTMSLIHNIRRRQHMWNPEDDTYRDKCKAAHAWKEVAATLQIPEHVARSKWKNLRDIFKRELRKFSVTSVEQYGGRWRYFEPLSFLLSPGRYLADDDTHTYIVKIDPGDDDKTHDDKAFPDEEFRDDDKVFCDSDKVYEDDRYEDDKVYADALDTISERAREDDFDESEAPAKKPRTDDDDYDMMFLKSLAPYFRALGPVKKLVVRNKIQEILLQELGSKT